MEWHDSDLNVEASFCNRCTVSLARKYCALYADKTKSSHRECVVGHVCNHAYPSWTFPLVAYIRTYLALMYASSHSVLLASHIVLSTLYWLFTTIPQISFLAYWILIAMMQNLLWSSLREWQNSSYTLTDAYGLW